MTGTRSASALNFPVPRRVFLPSMLEWKMWNLVAHYSLGDGMTTFFTVAGAFLYVKQVGSWHRLQSAVVPLQRSVLPTLWWLYSAALVPWSLTLLAQEKSSASKTKEVPTAWLVEEILRALVVTRAVGASQKWRETRTVCKPIWQPEGNCHRCPSHCLPCATCSGKFWWFLTNADFITFEVRIETKVWTFKILLFELPK